MTPAAQLPLAGVPESRGEVVTVEVTYCVGDAEIPLAVTCRVNLDGTGAAESMVDVLLAENLIDHTDVDQAELTEMWEVAHFKRHVSLEAYSAAVARRAIRRP